MASLDTTMWAEGNASHCIQAATCLPLGVPLASWQQHADIAVRVRLSGRQPGSRRGTARHSACRGVGSCMGFLPVEMREQCRRSKAWVCMEFETG